jgi:hypothetical protein
MNHFFENICNDCDHRQPDGECSVCPHIPRPGSNSRTEHFARRPCRGCGSVNMRTERVREPFMKLVYSGELKVERLDTSELDKP